MIAAELVGRWRAEAEVLRHRGCEDAARLMESLADELDAVLCAAQDETLSLAEAAAESGYTAAHLRYLVSEGKLRNRAASGPPRFRRGDLPRKPGHPAPAPLRLAASS